ncbi:hypothetical protein VRU48_11560 [Pedobacter sp. KR3-3]|uniref:Uncharacterized protein n=1 Tax=Pedobacter albus TaxID=3113905 RepID=A0ABU7I8Y5_9SPHI|nr:hypothetical protein [Pedobacter sp. KR3-3]MEE1945746.1 hypothetical protein [Pedobacter sp. KR3-3]
MKKTNANGLSLKKGEQLDRKQLKKVLGGGPGGPAGPGCLECIVWGVVKESTWYDACGSMFIDDYCKQKYGINAIGRCTRECSESHDLNNDYDPRPMEP